MYVINAAEVVSPVVTYEVVISPVLRHGYIAEVVSPVAKHCNAAEVVSRLVKHSNHSWSDIPSGKT